MQTAEGLHPLDSQFSARFKGKDRLMLGAMVLKDPLDIIHPGNGPDVDQEDDHPDHAIHQVKDHIMVTDNRHQQLGQIQRQEEKQGDTEAKGHRHGTGQGPGGQFFFFALAVLVHLFFKCLIGGKIQSLDPQDQRGKQGHGTTQDRQFHNRIPF